MLDALPQPAVLATSAASYLAAPAAGRRRHRLAGVPGRARELARRRRA
jgi:hypothetical protein